MSTQSVLALDHTDLCSIADNKLSCLGREYMRFYSYRVGDKPDINHGLTIERLRRVLCEDSCGLCEDEIAMVREYVNKIIS